ncbi:unnamed protein product [marine sediment metagenome]|uniref:Uncharacterized protein n=1 Tax=marine sediment metagenome TaxID=412755 RepID=X1U2B7_9ZZZZ
MTTEEKVVDIPELKYRRCGHKWVPRVSKPLKCPKCLSPYWNKERKDKADERHT